MTVNKFKVIDSAISFGTTLVCVDDYIYIGFYNLLGLSKIRVWNQAEFYIGNFTHNEFDDVQHCLEPTLK
jgi:hypothetical protein